MQKKTGNILRIHFKRLIYQGCIKKCILDKFTKYIDVDLPHFMQRMNFRKD
jgi:hypothetical protein